MGVVTKNGLADVDGANRDEGLVVIFRRIYLGLAQRCSMDVHADVLSCRNVRLVRRAIPKIIDDRFLIVFFMRLWDSVSCCHC